jgi:hypothetical protein
MRYDTFMRYAAPIFALALLWGCSKPAVHVTAAPSSTLADGWTLATDPQSGVSVGVAPGWRQGVDLTTDAMGQASGIANQTSIADPNNPMTQMQNQVNAMNKQEEDQALADLKAKGIVIQVIDGSRPIPGEERTRYYVKVVDHGGNCSLDDAVNDEKEAISGAVVQNIQLPIGKAAKFTSDTKTIGGDEVTRVSYVVVDGHNAYSLRFISTNNPGIIQRVADQVAQTWRIQPTKS